VDECYECDESCYWRVNQKVLILPVYDDPDYAWKQMVKKNGICDPYEKSIREFIEEFERIEKKLKQTGG